MTIEYLMVLICIIGFVITAISASRTYIIKNMGEVVKIEELEMLVRKKGCYCWGGKCVSPSSNMEYRVCLQDTKDKSKKKVIIPVNESDYRKLSRGETATVQRVLYKYKNKIYSEIQFAKNEHYYRLEEYLSNNKDEENLISKSTKIRKISPLYNKIITVLFIVFIVLMFADLMLL